MCVVLCILSKKWRTFTVGYLLVIIFSYSRRYHSLYNVDYTASEGSKDSEDEEDEEDEGDGNLSIKAVG